MKYYQIPLVFLITFLSTNIVFAQDLALNQYDKLGFKLNPALTGDFDGKYRLITHFRNQKQPEGEADPYRTFTVLLDGVVQKKENGWFGFGLGYRNRWQAPLDPALIDLVDQAKVNEFDLSLAYHRLLTTADGDRHLFSLGGIVNISHYDIPEFQFEGQVNVPIHTPSIDLDFIVPDFSVGFDWQHHRQSGTSFESGLAAYHLNQPNITFETSKNSVNQLPILWQQYSSVSFPIDDKFGLEPGYVLIKHGDQFNATFGLVAYYRFSGDTMPTLRLELQYKTYSESVINQSQSTATVIEVDWNRFLFSYAIEFFNTEQHNAQELMLAYRM